MTNLMAEFGFIVAAALGAAAGTTDLTDGVFRHLVITGRSRLALYLARIPAGLAILLPLVAVAFTMLCLVTSYAGVPQPTSVSVNNGVTVPAQLRPGPAADLGPAASAAGGAGVPARRPGPGPSRSGGRSSGIATDLRRLHLGRGHPVQPAANEMSKIGLWLKLEVGIGFMVGLGLGSLTGQRTLSTILLIGLEIIVTPILARTPIPYFLDGQRLDVGVAMDQLRPAGLRPPPAAAAPARQGCCSAGGAPSAYRRCRPGR